MAFSPSSPITGATVPDLSSPTYTITADNAPDFNGKQYYVSTLGGTQTGVSVHSVANPFTMAMFKPKVVAILSPVNPVTGQLPSVPMNRWSINVRKGMIPLANQPARVGVCRVYFDIPAGADAADKNSLEALVSCVGGLLFANASGIATTILTNSV